MARRVLLAVIAGVGLLGLAETGAGAGAVEGGGDRDGEQGISKIVGSAKAPYINSLIPQGKLFTNYSAVINGSLHNYLR